MGPPGWIAIGSTGWFFVAMPALLISTSTFSPAAPIRSAHAAIEAGELRGARRVSQTRGGEARAKKVSHIKPLRSTRDAVLNSVPLYCCTPLGA